jgi:ferredoxin
MAYRILENCKGCTACRKLCPVGAISGASKELHVVDARLCIDCGACGRICPYEAVQTPDGTLAVEVRRSRWPVPVWDMDLCTDCKICVKACPTGAIGLNGAHPLLKHRKLCIACTLCVISCPIGAVEMGS